MALQGRGNPAVVEEFNPHWYKICALLMSKLGLREVKFTTADIMKIEGMNVVINPVGEVLTILFLSDDDALAYLHQQKHG